MSEEDVCMTVVTCVCWGGFALGLVIMLVYCGESAEAAADRSRRAALAEYALALRSAAATPAPVEVELMRPVAPVAPVVAKKLGYFPYSAEGRRASEKLVCAICLEVFEHGKECSEVPACQHLFHRNCIAVWMKSKTTCPLCRHHIVAGSERVVSAADDMV